jgi:hypothetical protein
MELVLQELVVPVLWVVVVGPAATWVETGLVVLVENMAEEVPAELGQT